MGAQVAMAPALTAASVAADDSRPAGAKDDAAVLVEQERILTFGTAFGAEDALRIGCAVARLSSGYERGVGLRVYREADGLVLFQWMMDDKAPRHLDYIEGKRLMALRCGHSSLWAYARHELLGEWDGCFAAEAPECPTAGSFPIRLESGEWVATVSLSGLKDGADHELVVRALCEVLGRSYGMEVPAYEGVAA